MIDDIFSSVDEDCSGGIDFEEFQRIMGKQFDGSSGIGCSNNGSSNGCNSNDNNSNSNRNSNSDDSEEHLLAISNEQVRGCIFQKFGGTAVASAGAEGKNSQGTTITREMLRTIFDTMDLNKDGFLQLSEAITVLRETPGLDEDMISAWVRTSTVHIIARLLLYDK